MQGFDKLSPNGVGLAIPIGVPMVTASHILDRVLVLEMVRVTEAAAIAASKWTGRGDNDAADAAAV